MMQMSVSAHMRCYRGNSTSNSPDSCGPADCQ